MTDQMHTNQGQQFAEMRGLSFRGVQGECDYPLLLAINLSSRQGDKNDEVVSLEDIARVLAASKNKNPARNVLIAFLDDESTPVGSNRLGWYSSRADTRLYFQISFLRKEFRGCGIWQAMVRQNERRLREIAEEHPSVPQRFFQAWASDYQVDWISVLERIGYWVVRCFNNMLYRLDEVPNIPIPAGFEIRPVRPEHMHSIWEAQKK